MAFSAAATLQSALGLPTTSDGFQTNPDAFGSAFDNADEEISSAVDQAFSDFRLPSSTQLQAEAAEKLKSTGNADSFTSVSGEVSIIEENGQVIAASTSTGERLRVIGETTDQALPSSFIGATEDKTNEFKVILSAMPQISFGANLEKNLLDKFTLSVMPTISESRSASYKSFSPLHHPGEILKFENTSARQWSITGKLISRTVEEASLNLQIINTIRSWVMPFFGEGTFANMMTKPYLGAPPPIITLSAYGTKTIGPVKCVLESYSWDWPNDVDYLPTNEREPFPVIVNISLQLKEAWSPAEYSGFDISSYRQGILSSAFRSIPRSQIPNSQSQNAVPQTADQSRIDRSQSVNATQANINSGSSSNQGFIPNSGDREF